MKPVLAAWPAKKRTVFFAPFAVGAFFVVFLILAFSIQDFFYTLLLAPPLAIAIAWLLVGWPVLRRKDGKPLVEPAVKPYLFFALAPALAFVLYVISGNVLTKAGLDPRYLAWAGMGISIPLAIAGAYLLVGFPNMMRGVKDTYGKIPADRRPLLFYPVTAVAFLVIYLAIGVFTTQLLKRFPEQQILLLNLQVLLLLPVCLALAALTAWLLVGFPRIRRNPAEVLDKVTGKRRPYAFAATFLLAGFPLTTIVGAILTGLGKRGLIPPQALPTSLILPLAALLGFSLSLGLAALVWGTPTKWRARFDDYEPGLKPRVRVAVALASGVLTLVAVAVVFGLSGLDLFYGLLVGLFLGAAVALQLAGLTGAVLARRKADTLLPPMSDGLKAVVLFATWFGLAALLFATLTYALPNLVAWNAVGGLLVGLLVAVLLVEGQTFRRLLDDQRKARARRKALAAKRKEALREALEHR